MKKIVVRKAGAIRLTSVMMALTQSGVKKALSRVVPLGRDSDLCKH
jgi:hypothetical protein